MTTMKQDAEELVGRLSNEATWDDLMYAIHLHQKVERGAAAADAGRVVPHDDLKRRFAAG